ncbi:MAG: thiamine pyrophosphate-dependent enzyme, partial [Planctomycetota bacterium]
DVLEVRENTRAAASLAREHCTPALIEAKTYRYRGHSMSDPALYRTAEEVEQYKHQDPILMLKAAMLKAGADQPRLEEIDRAAKAEAKGAVEFALSSPEPESAELAEDVYAQPWGEKVLPRL